jgi:phosphatidylglycerophosphate synthase
VTPNLVTLLGLVTAAGGAAALGAGWNIVGGVALLVVAALDHVDGELARLRNATSRFGEAFDAVIDRYVDAVTLGGLALYAARFESHPHPETVGMLALGAALVASHSRARVDVDLRGQVHDGAMDPFWGLAGRDTRMLIAAAGAIVGQCYWALAVVAALAGFTAAWRLAYLRIKGIGAPVTPRT